MFGNSDQLGAYLLHKHDNRCMQLVTRKYSWLNMLTHADAATSTQPMAYDSNIHGQSCERLTFQVNEAFTPAYTSHNSPTIKRFICKPNQTKPNTNHVRTMEAIHAETVRWNFKMTSYHGKMLMIPYYIYINQQVTHDSIIYDRKKNANCNTFIHVLTLNAVVFCLSVSLV